MNIHEIRELATRLRDHGLPAPQRLRRCYGVAFPAEFSLIWSMYDRQIGLGFDLLTPFAVASQPDREGPRHRYLRDRAFDLTAEATLSARHPDLILLLSRPADTRFGGVDVSPSVWAYDRRWLARGGTSPLFGLDPEDDAPEVFAGSLCEALIAHLREEQDYLRSLAAYERDDAYLLEVESFEEGIEALRELGANVGLF